MASQETAPLTQSFTKTIGAGVGSLMSPGDKTYYILEHFVTSKFHQSGEQQKIIVDNIELGRDTHCQVRFDENFRTVSRRHAAIRRDGDNWQIVPLSSMNSTMLNGRALSGPWYLQSGDEIQLSLNGPKLRFIIPSGDSAGIKSIGFTQRLNLFREQALAPYKRAMTIIAIALGVAIAAIIGLVIFGVGIKQDVDNNAVMIADAIEQNKHNAQVADSLGRELMQTNETMHSFSTQMQDIKKMAEKAHAIARQAAKNATPSPDAFAEVAKNVYYMEFHVYAGGDHICNFSGTAFMLSDGRLVTAKHCVDLGYNSLSELEYDPMTAQLNAIHYFNPEALTYKFIAVSPTQDLIEVEFSPESSPWQTGYTELATGTVTHTDNSGEELQLPVKYKVNMTGDDDWAYIQTNRKGGLEFDAEWSGNLHAGTQLHILGFPRGVGTEELAENLTVKPTYSQSSVSHDGLYDGIILLSNEDTDSGNSGGPVFAQRNGKPVVVGILSGAEALGARNGSASMSSSIRDRVVPLSALK